ncbi:MAG: N-acetylmuramidase domain-containing protein [Hyphomonadaceae bacterium]
MDARSFCLNAISSRARPTVSTTKRIRPSPTAPPAYPRTQAERWISWRRPMRSIRWRRWKARATGVSRYGQNFGNLNMADAKVYVSKLARSEKDQLEAFEGFIRANGLADELQRLDWAAFASRYNGPGYAAMR